MVGSKDPFPAIFPVTKILQALQNKNFQATQETETHNYNQLPWKIKSTPVSRSSAKYLFNKSCICLFFKKVKRSKKHPLQAKQNLAALHTPTIPENMIHKSTLNKGGLRRISPNNEGQSGFNPRTAASCTQKSRVLLGAVASSVEHLLNRSQKCKSSIRYPIGKKQNSSHKATV